MEIKALATLKVSNWWEMRLVNKHFMSNFCLFVCYLEYKIGCWEESLSDQYHCGLRCMYAAMTNKRSELSLYLFFTKYIIMLMFARLSIKFYFSSYNFCFVSLFVSLSNVVYIFYCFLQRIIIYVVWCKLFAWPMK